MDEAVKAQDTVAGCSGEEVRFLPVRKVLHIMRLALSPPGGMGLMLPENVSLDEVEGLAV